MSSCFLRRCNRFSLAYSKCQGGKFRFADICAWEDPRRAFHQHNTHIGRAWLLSLRVHQGECMHQMPSLQLSQSIAMLDVAFCFCAGTDRKTAISWSWNPDWTLLRVYATLLIDYHWPWMMSLSRRTPASSGNSTMADIPHQLCQLVGLLTVIPN